MATRDLTRDGTMLRTGSARIPCYETKRSGVCTKTRIQRSSVKRGKRHIRFCQNKQMKTLRETIFASEGFDHNRTHHRLRWCISALFRKKRLPLEGKLATKLTDEVFRETNAMRSSDPQKLTLFCVSTSSGFAHATPYTLRKRFVTAVPSRVRSHVAISSPQGEGFWLRLKTPFRELIFCHPSQQPAQLVKKVF